MTQPISQVVVVGAGSAGLLSALAFRLLLPGVNVTLLSSPSKPVIGVGESTTVALPRFLHDDLNLDRAEFFDAVRPSWKLGIHFEWGPPEIPFFEYPFDGGMQKPLGAAGRPAAMFCLRDMTDFCYGAAMMSRGLAPLIAGPHGHYQPIEWSGYHIDNRRFLAYLDRKAKQFGVQFVAGDVVGIERTDAGDIAALALDGDRKLAADLFVDCSGFASELLGKALGVPYHSFAKTLFCDTAIVGDYSREGAVAPYTTATTMDHGWCWKIEFEDRVTRGYVHSSKFCDLATAERELRAKNPLITGDVRTIRFPSGRYDRYWERNVVAIGNSSGFVEPLEATALQMIVEQLRMAVHAIREAAGTPPVAGLRTIQNRRAAALWDDIRDFLAIHYRFNRRLDTPFWKHCREHVELCGAATITELYRQVGPNPLLQFVMPPLSIFGWHGYLNLLLGQQVPTEFQFTPTEDEAQDWRAWREAIRADMSRCLPTRDGLELVRKFPGVWNRRGI